MKASRPWTLIVVLAWAFVALSLATGAWVAAVTSMSVAFMAQRIVSLYQELDEERERR